MTDDIQFDRHQLDYRTRRAADDAATEYLNTVGAARGLLPIDWTVQRDEYERLTKISGNVGGYVKGHADYDDSQFADVARGWVDALELSERANPVEGTSEFTGEVAGIKVAVWYISNRAEFDRHAAQTSQRIARQRETMQQAIQQQEQAQQQWGRSR